MSRRRVLLGLLASALIVACGRKGDPKPPSNDDEDER